MNRAARAAAEHRAAADRPVGAILLANCADYPYWSIIPISQGGG
jgi:hypothetical protein